ncbi:MAG: hypothetical protein RL112_2211 [Planctomycetota bacterium]
MKPEDQIDPIEARVLGVLVEKQLTTPDSYPLSLNSTTVGCNQKSNRDPVTELLDGEVHQALSKLIIKGYAGLVTTAGSRVEKYRHNVRERLALSDQEVAVLAELLLRGPQQPGEMRARASRMQEIATQEALMAVLRGLESKGLAQRHDPPPGSRAEFWSQRLAPTAHPLPSREATLHASPTVAPIAATAPSGGPVDPLARIGALEGRVAKLESQLAALAAKLGEGLEG